MSYWQFQDRDQDISPLVGKTLRAVTQNGDDSIHFESTTGEQWKMFHNQLCCESVNIEDVVGDLQDLVGAPILMAEVSTNSVDGKHSLDPDVPDESFTWTFYKLATAKGYVTIRWYGYSNGYYSERVSFEKVDND